MLDWVLCQIVCVAHVECAVDLVVLHDRAQFEYRRCSSEGSDAERVEEVGDEAETEQASKVEAAGSVSRRGHRRRYVRSCDGHAEPGVGRIRSRRCCRSCAQTCPTPTSMCRAAARLRPPFTSCGTAKTCSSDSTSPKLWRPIAPAIPKRSLRCIAGPADKLTVLPDGNPRQLASRLRAPLHRPGVNIISVTCCEAL